VLDVQFKKTYATFGKKNRPDEKSIRDKFPEIKKYTLKPAI
jgi:hypothetical protein